MSRAAAASLVLLIVAGCTKRTEGGSDARSPARPAVARLARGVDPAAAVATPRRPARPPSPEQLEQALLGLASCRFTAQGIDRACKAHEAYSATRGALIRSPRLPERLGLKHLSHASPAVRFVAAGLLRVAPVPSDATRQAVLKAVPAEKNPLVLARMIAAVRQAVARDPRIGRLLLSMADHEDETVRLAAVAGLSTPWAAGLKGSIEKLTDKILRDASIKVRHAACAGAGNLGDDRLLPLYSRLTRNPQRDPELHAACMRGLVQMWNPFLERERRSKRAFTLTLGRLRLRPRGQQHPPWVIMSHLGRIPGGEQPPRWWDRKALVKVLVEIAQDVQAGWLTRAGAAKALGGLGARTELHELVSGLAATADHGSRNVLSAARRALSSLP